MKVKIRAFGIAGEIVGGATVEIEFNGKHVGELRATLLGRFPALGGLKSILIAVGQSYAEDSQTISENDEIALIPPVSGG